MRVYPTYLGGSWQLNTPLPAASFADIERWESDTDSGGSDEEVDFKEGGATRGATEVCLHNEISSPLIQSYNGYESTI